MTQFSWKILSIIADGESITGAKYYCKATEDDLFVETEGFAYGDFSFGINYKDITENNVIDSIKNIYTQNGLNLIESNLEKQLKSLQKEPVLPPWHVETFKVGI